MTYTSVIKQIGPLTVFESDNDIIVNSDIFYIYRGQDGFIKSYDAPRLSLKRPYSRVHGYFAGEDNCTIVRFVDGVLVATRDNAAFFPVPQPPDVIVPFLDAPDLLNPLELQIEDFERIASMQPPGTTCTYLVDQAFTPKSKQKAEAEINHGNPGAILMVHTGRKLVTVTCPDPQ
jgi:hypothetical protein